MRPKTSSVDYDNEDNVAIKKHCFDKFDRCHDMFDECWSSRYHYILFSILMSNSNDVNLHMLKLETELSGGIFIMLLILVSFVFAMPLIYIEIFFGKYTRLTNCQMYRMATIFFGFNLAMFLVNVAYQVIGIPDNTMVLVSAIKSLSFNSMKNCMDNKECYNYLTDGPVNESCETVFMGMQCEGKGLIRFSNQYLYWKMFLDSDDKYYPHSQLIAGLALTWGIILYISMKELDTLGSIMNGAFIFHFIIMTIVFILGLIYLKSTECFTTLINVDPNLLTSQNIVNAVWYILGHFAFVFSSSYMTIYAYAHFSTNLGFDGFIITFFNLILTFYYFIIYYIAAGVIAGNMAVQVANTVVPEGGLFFIVIPEFFEHLELPNTFLFIYYCSVWFLGVVKNSVCLHTLLLNWYDYFPKTKIVSSYVTVIACTVLCLLGIPACSKNFIIVVIPLLMSVGLRIIVELCVTVMSTMVCYVYGVSRLCEDIEFDTGRKPIKYWRIMWCIIPVFGWFFLSEKDVIRFANNSNMLTTITNNQKQYVWILYLVFLTTVILFTVLKIIPHLTTPNLILKLIKPQFYWGPPNRNTRIKRKDYDTTKKIRSEVSKINDSANMEKLTYLINETFEEWLN